MTQDTFGQLIRVIGRYDLTNLMKCYHLYLFWQIIYLGLSLFHGREGQFVCLLMRRGKDGQRWTSLTTKGPSAMPSMPPRNMVVIPMSLRIALRLFQEGWLVICISVFPPVPISADHLLSIVRTHIQHLDSDGWHLEAEDKNQDILRILGNQWMLDCLSRIISAMVYISLK